MDGLRAVAIDGPAGAGKSTVARGVASRLGFLYLDTGAMYRAVAWKASVLGVDLLDAEAMAGVARGLDLAFDPTGRRLTADGADVTRAIRSPELTAITRYAARSPGVREEMVRRQRSMAHRAPVVMEGRDIGLVVLPGARWKYFLTASPEARARRRWEEDQRSGRGGDLETVLARQAERDAADDQVGPLRTLREMALAGEGVAYIDTTHIEPEEVIGLIAGQVEGDDSPAR